LLSALVNGEIEKMKNPKSETDELDDIEEELDTDSVDSDDVDIDEEIEEIDVDENESSEPEATRAIVIPLTQTQYEVVIMALQHIKDQFDFPISDGKAEEILAAEYLSGIEHE